MTKEVAESIGLGKPVGALVRQVEVGGPAEKAGVEAGDIITKVDGPQRREQRRPAADHRRHQAGQQGEPAGFRRGGYRDLPVVVAEFEPEKVAAKRPAEREGAKPAPQVGTLGLALADLTDAQKRDLKLKNGVRVESAEGVAARAGVQEGDVIVTLDNVEVTSVKQFDAAGRQARKEQGASPFWCARARSPGSCILRPVPLRRGFTRGNLVGVR